MASDTDDDFDDDEYDDDDYDDDEYDEDDEDDEDDEFESPKRSSSLKWGWLAVILMAIVAIVLVAVVIFGGDTDKAASGGLSTSEPGTDAEGGSVASAKDTGPVTVITEDPSCTGWTSMIGNLQSTLQAIGGGKWQERDRAKPASAWSDEERKINMAAAQLIRTTAAQTVGLVKVTPHRVMRELYEQFIAYARNFAERVPNYTPADDNLAATAHSTASALASICTAITDGSAALRGSMVKPLPAPSKTAPPGSLENPQPFLTGSNPVCMDWRAAVNKFLVDTAEWRELDPNVPATFWNPQQRQINLGTAQVMIAYANTLQQLGQRADNPILQDFADLGSQYRNAFVLAVPTYSPADQHLANVATFVNMAVLGACGAAG